MTKILDTDMGSVNSCVKIYVKTKTSNVLTFFIRGFIASQQMILTDGSSALKWKVEIILTHEIVLYFMAVNKSDYDRGFKKGPNNFQVLWTVLWKVRLIFLLNMYYIWYYFFQ